MSTIVVFERDALLRRSLRILLETKDYAVIEVATGDGALQALRKLADPGVLVVHHRLPEMDALMMLVRIANDPALAARHRVVVIPSLGSRLHQPLPTALREVNVWIVPLPYELHTLHAVIGRALRTQDEPAPARDPARDSIITHDGEQPPLVDGAAHWTRSGAGTPQTSSPRRNPSMNGHVPPPGPQIQREGESSGADPGAPPV
jgi:CheY-like chemotaxis protein